MDYSKYMIPLKEFDLFEAMEAIVQFEIYADAMEDSLLNTAAMEAQSGVEDDNLASLGSDAKKAMYELRSANESGDTKGAKAAKDKINKIIDEVEAADVSANSIEVINEREAKKRKIKKIVIIIASLAAMIAIASMIIKKNPALKTKADNLRNMTKNPDKMKPKDVLREAKAIINENITTNNSGEVVYHGKHSVTKSEIEQEIEDTQFVLDHTSDPTKKSGLAHRISDLKKKLNAA